MSIDAYKIAIQIALTENVTRGLMSMSKNFSAANLSAKELETRLASIGKMAMVGGAAMGIGALGIKLLEKPLNAAKDWETELAKLRQMGLGDGQIEEAQKYVKATDVIGKSMQDRMRLFTEAQGAFRESGKSGVEALDAAKVMMPILGTYETAMTTLSSGHRAAAEGAMRNLSKTVEIMGGINNTEKAREIADGVFKAVQSSGKMVDERQLKQFVAYGGSATNQLGVRAIMGGLEPIIAMLGGSSTAVGLRTAYTRVNGMMALPPKLMLHEMQRLGMTDATGRKQDLSLANLQSTDAVAYAQEVIKRYQKNGIVSKTDQERENAILFGTKGAVVMNQIMDKMSVISESLASYDKSRGASDVVKNIKNNPLIAKQIYEAKLADFQLVLGRNGGLLDLATKGLTLLANSIERITVFADKHPMLTKFAVEATALTSGLLLLGGSVIMVKAGLSALGLVRIASIASSLGGGAGLAGAIGTLASPIGLAIAGVAGLVGVVYSLTKLLPMFMGDGIHDKINHPGQHFSRHGRGANNGVWIDDVTGKVVAAEQERIMNSQRLADKAKRSASLSWQDHDGKHYVRGGRGGAGRWVDDKPIHITVVSNLNGREVARAVTTHQSKELSRPSTGGSQFDPTQGPLPVGL